MSPQELRESKVYPTEFIIQDTDLEVISYNFDTDSATFTYKTSIADAAIFWAEINNLIEEFHWQVLDNEGNVRRYERLLPPQGTSGFYSAEEMRIAYDSRLSRVLVAWVQADSSKSFDSFEEAENVVDVRYAQERVWPEFEKILQSFAIDD
jgi:hypothetical protein